MRVMKFAAVVIFLTSLSISCGGKYDKPLEVDKEPRLGAYNYAGTYRGFDSATHLAVTGGNLFVSYEETGQIRRYYSTAAPLDAVKFRDLNRPTVVGKGRKVIAVADGSETITVKVYSISGGNPTLSFQDPDWQQIGGLAIDDSGNIYVSDMARNFVRSYDSSGNRRFEIDLADSGFGIGHVLSPRGIYFDGEALLIAEAHPEKSQIQRIRIDSPQEGILFSPEVPFISTFTDVDGNEIALTRPVAVATDAEGYIIVLDEGLGKIFRYTFEGISDAIVNSITSGGPDMLDAPVSVGTYKERVYCLERETGIIHRWDGQ
jgi:outer membrane protein assembly factor BamB